jgi:hypothetical protein
MYAKTGLLLLLLGLSLSCAIDQEVNTDGIEFEADAEEWPGILEDRELQAYLDGMLKRLQGARGELPSPVEVRVFRYPGANAVALPHGVILIGVGMLAAMNSEEELAMVLGHELGHLQARHSHKGVSRWLRLHHLGLLALPLVTMMGDPELLSGALTETILPAYSREEERVADDIGVDYLRAAGLDVGCGLRLFRTMERANARAKTPNSYGFFSTHPEPAERFDRLAGPVDAGAPRGCDTSYLDRLQGLRLVPLNSPAYEEADGASVLPWFLLRIRPQDGQELSFGRDGFVLKAPFVTVEITAYKDGETIEWAGDQARGWVDEESRAKVILLDTEDRGGRPSVRLVRQVRHKMKSQVMLFHWVDFDGRLYRFSARTALKEWEQAEPVLLDLVSRIEALGPADLDTLGLVPKIAIHIAGENETLHSLAEIYPDSSEEELCFLNAIDAEEELRAGQQVKIVERFPLPVGERQPPPPQEEELWGGLATPGLGRSPGTEPSRAD